MSVYKQIDKGLFTTVYLMPKNKVLLKSCDPIKECMAHGWFPDSRLFPKVELTANYNEYTMVYYPKVSSLKRALQPHDWEMYQTLRKLDLWCVNGREGLCDVFKTIKNRRLRNAVISAVEACANYGDDVCFEISPRNVAVTKAGRLVLLDCFFMGWKLKELRA